MDRPRAASEPTAPRRLIASLAIACLCVLIGGCSADFRASREGPNPWTTEIPGEIGVMTAIAASEQTLRSWGYAIELDLATETRGRVVGRESEPRAYGLLRGESVEISAYRGKRTTHLKIEQSTADEHEARALLRDVRARLGLSQ